MRLSVSVDDTYNQATPQFAVTVLLLLPDQPLRLWGLE